MFPSGAVQTTRRGVVFPSGAVQTARRGVKFPSGRIWGLEGDATATLPERSEANSEMPAAPSRFQRPVACHSHHDHAT